MGQTFQDINTDKIKQTDNGWISGFDQSYFMSSSPIRVGGILCDGTNEGVSEVSCIPVASTSIYRNVIILRGKRVSEAGAVAAMYANGDTHTHTGTGTHH